MEDARKAIAQAEARTAEYADKLRLARADAYKIREQRVKQWTAERDAALDTARKASGKQGQPGQSRDGRRSRARPAGDSGLSRRSGQPGRSRRSAGGRRGVPLRHSDPQARSSAWPFSIAFLAVLLLAATFAVPRHAAAQQPAPASNSAASAPAANDDTAQPTPNDELKEMDVFRHSPIVQSIGRKMRMDVETTARVFEAINFAHHLPGHRDSARAHHAEDAAQALRDA